MKAILLINETLILANLQLDVDIPYLTDFEGNVINNRDIKAIRILYDDEIEKLLIN